MSVTLTIAEVAKQLKVCTKTVRNYITAGLKASKLRNRTIRIAQADLDQFLKWNALPSRPVHTDDSISLRSFPRVSTRKKAG